MYQLMVTALGIVLAFIDTAFQLLATGTARDVERRCTCGVAHYSGIPAGIVRVGWRKRSPYWKRKRCCVCCIKHRRDELR